MKVLLLKDIYNLGRAGDVKKVANGYGRNYLIPQGLAVLATPGALKQVEHIRTKAEAQRAVLNKELSGVADQLSALALTFPAKASETGKLYGSVTSQMIADAIKEKIDFDVNRRQLDHQPIRTLGEHTVRVRLTVDLIPEISVLVYREGETPEMQIAADKLALEREAEQALVEPEVEPEDESAPAVEAEAEVEAAAEQD